jgi:hypothetical protein
MMHTRQIRGLMATGTLVAAGIFAAAGCGTVVAGSSATTGSSAKSGTGTDASSTSSTATGCASIDLATKVTVLRAMHLIEPTRTSQLQAVQSSPAKVQALFRDFCAVVTHPFRGGVLHCPMDVGLAYGGTFYDGSRVLATYTYEASGCQVVTLVDGTKQQKSVVAGSAAAAAPNLESDLAKVLDQSQAEVFKPLTHGQQSGGMKG